MQQKKNATIDVFMIPQNWSFSMLMQHIFCVFLQQMQIRNHKMARPQETLEYRTHAIITRGLYIFNPLFECQKRFFQGDFFRKFWFYVHG